MRYREVDLEGGISDEELESDWEYESEPYATKQGETILTNVVMTEQCSASRGDPEYNDNDNVLMKIMWTVLITIQLPVLVITVTVVLQQMMKDFPHNQRGKKLCKRVVVDPG